MSVLNDISPYTFLVTAVVGTCRFNLTHDRSASEAPDVTIILNSSKICFLVISIFANDYSDLLIVNFSPYFV
jgi:hypothetical protein